MRSVDNFTAKLTMIRQRLDRIQSRQTEHFRLFKRLTSVNTNLKALINVLNTISVTSMVLTFSGTYTTLVVCAVSNSLSALCTAVLSVVRLDDKVHSHQTSYLQFVEIYDTYIAELLIDDLNGSDLDRILGDLNTKVGLILDKCEPIDLSRIDKNDYVPSEQSHDIHPKMSHPVASSCRQSPLSINTRRQLPSRHKHQSTPMTSSSSNSPSRTDKTPPPITIHNQQSESMNHIDMESQYHHHIKQTKSEPPPVSTSWKPCLPLHIPIHFDSSPSPSKTHRMLISTIIPIAECSPVGVEYRV